MKAKLFNTQNLLYVALVLALVSSLGHVAFAFSTTNGNNWLEAYVSAIAIDVGMLALAAGINRRKAQKRGSWVLWLGVVMFSAISTYANWLAGIVHTQPLSATVTGLAAWLVGLRPILLSSVLPILVIYLSEIVSDNHEYEQAQEAKAQKRSVTQRVATELETVNAQRVATKKRKVAKLATILEAEPAATNNQLAQRLGVSESTIRNYKTELELAANGRTS